MTDASSPRPPPWERLRAPESGRLTVAPLERRSLAVLRVVDGDLPDLDGATLVWIDRLPDGRWHARAARIDGEVAEPSVVTADRVEVIGRDPALARLMGEAVPLGAGGAEPAGCTCRSVAAGSIAAAAGWRSVDAVKRATRAASGACQGRRCVAAIGAALALEPADPRSQITARPPLVPLPVALLAAFVADR